MRRALVGAVTLVLAAALGFSLDLWRPAVPGPAVDSGRARAEAQAERAALREALADEVFAREQLAAEVELMRAVLAELSEGSGAGEPEGGETRSEADPAPDETERAADREDDEDQRFADALVGFGFLPSEIQALQSRWDEVQLEKLELADRAMRKGWLHQPRHRRQVERIDAQLRADLGEDGYERMLIATRQPNRVVVRSVLRGSAAATAGVRDGDHLIAYAGQRLFSPNDVRKATAAGVKGESVQIQVERAGRRLSYVVPRGPLGLQLSVAKVPPQ